MPQAEAHFTSCHSQRWVWSELLPSGRCLKPAMFVSMQEAPLHNAPLNQGYYERNLVYMFRHYINLKWTLILLKGKSYDLMPGDTARTGINH